MRELSYPSNYFFSKTKLKLLIKIKLKEDNDSSIKNIIWEYILENLILNKKYQDKNIFSNNNY